VRCWHKTYFHRADGPPIQTPVVIEVEADESQNANVEQNLPSGYQAAVTIDPGTPVY
jgi:hypothetical protein